MKYIAFLRGINVGGNHRVPMETLRSAFADLGFTEIKTLLNSGNVLFSSDEKDVSSLKKRIEKSLEETFGFLIGTIIRSQKELQEMVAKNPFKNTEVTPQTRLYVTFLSIKPKNSFGIPYESPEKNFKILDVSDGTIFSVLQLSEKYNTTDAMNVLGKEYGKNMTTRNWNTVIKIVAL